MATATMPRHPNGGQLNANGRQHSFANGTQTNTLTSANAKKKSVTIGTFTTVETFDSNFSSAV